MEPFVGEIKLCAFAFPPRGWALCNGALVRINQNRMLYALLGTQYGGDGIVTFALPDLRGRVAVHRDVDHPQGTAGGLERVTLSDGQVPAHNHPFNVSSTPGTAINIDTTQDHLLAASQVYDASTPSSSKPGKPIYAAATNLIELGRIMCDPVGAGAAHENMQPSLVLNYVIALDGIYPIKG
ncbi:phage tail protein [Trinickia fusca]|uniref:Phage tail collar domain-containing protein n=1 Tax=Trinickia fusca TaxID=2419777 RepID=A0A494X9H8_9BURK|nr:tail fiber protein [Trinickia fusca]RKP47417.1 hypothetical protein D7S89_14265 [Trinickia fusca]